jgi:hypothetical protein
MLSPELIKKVDQVFIRSSHKVTDVFAGEFESAFRGRGIEFEEFREYVPGDDVRLPGTSRRDSIGLSSKFFARSVNRPFFSSSTFPVVRISERAGQSAIS